MAIKFIKTPENHESFRADCEHIKVQTTDDNATISDLGELFKHFLLACGYSPQGVNAYFGDEE